MAVRTVELSQPLSPLTDIQDYYSARIFVTWQGTPIGSVDVANAYGPVSVDQLTQAIACEPDLIANREELQRDRPTAPASLPEDVMVSVILPTCNRPDDLRTCLQHLTSQQVTHPVEIIVVDNRPASGMTPPVVAEFSGVRLVAEARPGASYARNTGVAHSQGEIIVTIDDDVTPPPQWLANLIAPFANPQVMSVTGNILPVELATPAQQIFEIYADGGLGRGFRSFEVTPAWLYGSKAAAPLWELGATANAAFRASLFRHPDIGLWDEMLGAGVPAGGGEDIYLFYKILRAGFTHVYEPRAWVWHQHRRDISALRRQIFNYSRGVVAYHLMTLWSWGDGRALLTLAMLPMYYAKRAVWRLTGRLTYPLSFILLEIIGHGLGAWGLWRSRHHVRRYGKSYLPVLPGPARSTPAVNPHPAVTVDSTIPSLR